MASSKTEGTRITIGGKSRRHKLSISALRFAQKVHGSDLSLNDFASFTPEMLPQLVWVGLLHDDPDLKERDVLLLLAQSDNEPEILAQIRDSLKDMTDSITKAMDMGTDEGDAGNV